MTEQAFETHWDTALRVARRKSGQERRGWLGLTGAARQQLVTLSSLEAVTLDWKNTTLGFQTGFL